MSINPDKVPSNLNEAVELICGSLSEEDRAFILAADDSSSVHFTVGMCLRNNWSLWEKDTPIHNWFRKELGICFADDISGTILASVWHKVRGLPFEAKDHVKFYHEHWRRHGIDPVTMEQLEME